MACSRTVRNNSSCMRVNNAAPKCNSFCNEWNMIYIQVKIGNTVAVNSQNSSSFFTTMERTTSTPCAQSPPHHFSLHYHQSLYEHRVLHRKRLGCRRTRPERVSSLLETALTIASSDIPLVSGQKNQAKTTQITQKEPSAISDRSGKVPLTEEECPVTSHAHRSQHDRGCSRDNKVE